MAQIKYNELGLGRTNLKHFDESAHEGAYLFKEVFKDAHGSAIDILTVNNGVLEYTILFQRGMDIGNMRYKGKQIGWQRDSSFLLHPNNVNLEEGGVHVDGAIIKEGIGWVKGFYAMDAMVGPRHFGGPCIDNKTQEKLTLHDRNSYSLTGMESVVIEMENGLVTVSGLVPIVYSGEKPTFERETKIKTYYGQNSLIRADTTKNTSLINQILDDGHHIQFGGALLWEGSRYVSSAPLEARDKEAKKYLEGALEIPAPTAGFFPERCYFIEPRPVSGAEGVFLQPFFEEDITVQMIRTADSSLGGFVAHRIGHYKNVTFWQQYGGWQFDKEQKGPIWHTAAIEPARSFPDNRNNKKGLTILKPGDSLAADVEIGAVEGQGVKNLEEAIVAALKR